LHVQVFPERLGLERMIQRGDGPRRAICTRGIVRHQEEPFGTFVRRDAGQVGRPQADVVDAVLIHVSGERSFANTDEAELDRGIDLAIDPRIAGQRSGGRACAAEVELEPVFGPCT